MIDFTFGDWQVGCAPECGGNLNCVRWRGIDIMRAFTAEEEWKKAPTNYGFAVLFPPNRIADGKFVFRGEKYALPVNEPQRSNHAHGIALRELWKLDGYSENSVSMSFLFDNTHNAYEGFPFSCRLSVTYTFRDNELEQCFSVKNLSDRVMPCALGFHSAFTMPERMRVSGNGGCIETLPPRYLASGKITPWKNGFEPNKWCEPAKLFPFGHFSAGASPLAEFDHQTHKVFYIPDPKFKYWMVWRHEEEFDYICTEPMNIKIGTFENAPEELPTVAPGEEESFISKVTVSLK